MRSFAATALFAILCVPAVHAQGVLLRVHPHVGDTLHTRLEQQTEVSTTMPGSNGRAVKSVTTSVTLNSRTIVQASSPTSTLVLTIVDSADLRTSDTHGAAQVAEAERSLRGQQMMLQLGADGTVESARDVRGIPVPRDVADAMSAMPAVFPRRAVAVGEQWTRELPLPSGGALGARGSAHVSATFRLDSLDRGGNLAWVSMRGEIIPDAGNQGMELTGGVTGSMQVDRQRGWMTDSRFSVIVRSLVTPPAVSGLAPMRFVTRVTQRLRTMDKR
ncbi:MAG TPA: DUF6263 family protein [Gemmatimonadaceae bacterium]|nr:DUF6263 family protein [Gemmatimonadaceae bacterium]